MTETPDIHAAPAELLALARAVRPEWDHDILEAAILGAKNAGWTWTRTLLETVRLMADPEGSPWDLKRAAASPVERHAPQAGTYERGGALWREALGIDPGSAA